MPLLESLVEADPLEHAGENDGTAGNRAARSRKNVSTSARCASSRKPPAMKGRLTLSACGSLATSVSKCRFRNSLPLGGVRRFPCLPEQAVEERLASVRDGDATGQGRDLGIELAPPSALSRGNACAPLLDAFRRSP
jgi:hypothetical protein